MSWKISVYGTATITWQNIVSMLRWKSKLESWCPKGEGSLNFWLWFKSASKAWLWLCVEQRTKFGFMENQFCSSVKVKLWIATGWTWQLLSSVWTSFKYNECFLCKRCVESQQRVLQYGKHHPTHKSAYVYSILVTQITIHTLTKRQPWTHAHEEKKKGVEGSDPRKEREGGERAAGERVR